MPGFNQRGPMNEGPMTGGQRGTCSGSVDPDQKFAGRGNAMGMGRQRGRRGYQEPGFGRGYGQRTSPIPAPVTGFADQNKLQDSVDMLEAELKALKQQLKNLNESRE